MSYADPTLPDAGQGQCCMGAAAMGPGRCTCWRPVHDLEQQPPRPGGPRTRTECCGDCAFRPDSPERQGDQRYQHSDEGELSDLVRSEHSFVCHDGMRRKLALVHEPTGVRLPIDVDAYDPPVIDGVAYKADGSPADLCAGLAAQRKRT